MKRTTLNIFTDGGARGNPGPSAAAFVVIKNKELFYQDSFYLGVQTNNAAEYQGLLRALKWTADNFNGENVRANFFLDSLLVVNQMKGEYKIKNPKLQFLAKEVKEKERNFSGKISYNYIPRNNNKLADKLLNNVLDEKL